MRSFNAQLITLLLGCWPLLLPAQEWIDRNKVDELAKQVAPPPTVPSPEEKADVDRLLALQRTRTTEDCKRAASEVRISLDSYFGPEYGPLTETEVEKYGEFFKEVQSQASYFVGYFKNRYQRRRPNIAYPRIKPCIHLEESPAYPSGHSTIAETLGETLTELFPERRALIEKRARQIAEDRAIGGVHYPTDVSAGLSLGHLLFQEMMKSDDFKNKLKQIRANARN